MRATSAIIAGLSLAAIAASYLGVGADTFGRRAVPLDRAGSPSITAPGFGDQPDDPTTPTPEPPSSWPAPMPQPTTSRLTTGRPVATEEESAGVVLINTVVDWGENTAAGTGLVVDEDGIVVTNHHVVQGSTRVAVTVPQTGRTYDAAVLGYSTTEDVAVLRLLQADNLTTITASEQPVDIGESITAVGNAGGTGTLVSATGQVSDLDRSITATDSSGRNPEDLSGLIEISAELVPGDSGGALLDGDGTVVGMNVAGSAGNRATTSYAIPIDTVESVIDQVLTGAPSDTVVLERTAALGIVVSGRPTTAGLGVMSVVSDGPADLAGLRAGSWLTALDGVALSTSTDLSAILAQHSPGDVVSLAWTDRTGASQTADVRLAEAPLA